MKIEEWEANFYWSCFGVSLSKVWLWGRSWCYFISINFATGTMSPLGLLDFTPNQFSSATVGLSHVRYFLLYICCNLEHSIVFDDESMKRNSYNCAWIEDFSRQCAALKLCRFLIVWRQWQRQERPSLSLPLSRPSFELLPSLLSVALLLSPLFSHPSISRLSYRSFPSNHTLSVLSVSFNLLFVFPLPFYVTMRRLVFSSFVSSHPSPSFFMPLPLPFICSFLRLSILHALSDLILKRVLPWSLLSSTLVD